MKSFIKILLNSLRSSLFKSEKRYKNKKIKILNSMIKEYKLFSDISNITLAILVFLSGVILIISALYPPVLDRIKFMQEMLPISFLQLSHRISLLIGLMLLMTSKEIFCKVKRSYYFTMVLLILGSIFTFLKGFDYEEAIFVFVVLVILRLSKKSFYRKSVPIKLTNYTVIAIGIVSILTLIYRIIYEYKHKLVKIHEYSYYIDLFAANKHYIEITVFTYISFMIFLILWYITSDKIDNNEIYKNKVNIEELTNFLNSTNNGDALTHLVYLGDKKVFWGLNGESMIVYAKYNDNIIVLGNPVVNREKLGECIQEFQNFLDLYGYKPSFYQIDEKNLPIYHENGYYFFKLGEEAVVDLEEFNLLGKKRSSFRNILRRFEKDGYYFEVRYPEFENEFLEELKVVSNEWIGKRKEKSFSLGNFNKSYLQKAPIAIVKNNKDDKIIAFISLMYNYDEKSMSMDLMRHLKNLPNSTMEFLILSTLLYLKDKGYKYFNLGEAPLSNVGITQNSHTQEKLARLVYNYGQKIYSFSGLRRFKEKFTPSWEPRYLAYSKFISLPEILLDISIVINVPKKNYNHENEINKIYEMNK